MEAEFVFAIFLSYNNYNCIGIPILPRRAKFLFVHSFFPILAGIFIYLFWRSESLLAFRWFSVIHMSGKIVAARTALPKWLPPGWFLFSLPDGLWAYAATNAIGGLWLEDWRPEARYWLLLPSLLGCVAELGQVTHQVPGTFSALDIAAYLGGGLLGLFVTETHRSLGEQNEIKNPA